MGLSITNTSMDSIVADLIEKISLYKNQINDSANLEDLATSNLSEADATSLIMELIAYVTQQTNININALMNKLYIGTIDSAAGVDSTAKTDLLRLLKLVGYRLPFQHCADVKIGFENGDDGKEMADKTVLSTACPNPFEFSSASSFLNFSYGTDYVYWEFINYDPEADKFDYLTPVIVENSPYGTYKKITTAYQGRTNTSTKTITEGNTISVGNDIYSNSVRIYYLKNGTPTELTEIDNIYSIKAQNSKEFVYKVDNSGNGVAKIYFPPSSICPVNKDLISQDVIIFYRYGTSTGKITKNTFNTSVSVNNVSYKFSNYEQSYNYKAEMTASEIQAFAPEESRALETLTSTSDYEYLIPRNNPKISKIKVYGENNFSDSSTALLEFYSKYGSKISPLNLWIFLMKDITEFTELYLQEDPGSLVLTDYINDIDFFSSKISDRMNEYYNLKFGSSDEITQMNIPIKGSDFTKDNGYGRKWTYNPTEGKEYISDKFKNSNYSTATIDNLLEEEGIEPYTLVKAENIPVPVYNSEGKYYFDNTTAGDKTYLLSGTLDTVYSFNSTSAGIPVSSGELGKNYDTLKVEAFIDSSSNSATTSATWNSRKSNGTAYLIDIIEELNNKLDSNNTACTNGVSLLTIKDISKTNTVSGELSSFSFFDSFNALEKTITLDTVIEAGTTYEEAVKIINNALFDESINAKIYIDKEINSLNGDETAKIIIISDHKFEISSELVSFFDAEKNVNSVSTTMQVGTDLSANLLSEVAYYISISQERIFVLVNNNDKENENDGNSKNNNFTLKINANSGYSNDTPYQKIKITGNSSKILEKVFGFGTDYIDNSSSSTEKTVTLYTEQSIGYEKNTGELKIVLSDNHKTPTDMYLSFFKTYAADDNNFNGIVLGSYYNNLSSNEPNNLNSQIAGLLSRPKITSKLYPVKYFNDKLNGFKEYKFVPKEIYFSKNRVNTLNFNSLANFNDSIVIKFNEFYTTDTSLNLKRITIDFYISGEESNNSFTLTVSDYSSEENLLIAIKNEFIKRIDTTTKSGNSVVLDLSDRTITITSPLIDYYSRVIFSSDNLDNSFLSEIVNNFIYFSKYRFLKLPKYNFINQLINMDEINDLDYISVITKDGDAKFLYHNNNNGTEEKFRKNEFTSSEVSPYIDIVDGKLVATDLSIKSVTVKTNEGNKFLVDKEDLLTSFYFDFPYYIEYDENGRNILKIKKPELFPSGNFYVHTAEDFTDFEGKAGEGTDEFDIENSISSNKLICLNHIYRKPIFIPFSLKINITLSSVIPSKKASYKTDLIYELKTEYGLGNRNIGQSITKKEITTFVNNWINDNLIKTSGDLVITLGDDKDYITASEDEILILGSNSDSFDNLVITF